MNNELILNWGGTNVAVLSLEQDFNRENNSNQAF